MNDKKNKIEFYIPSDDFIKIESLCDDNCFTKAELMRRLVSDYIKDHYKSYDLYLEISGRHTGKTTRLIDEVIYHATHTGDATVYSTDATTSNFILEKIIERVKFLNSQYNNMIVQSKLEVILSKIHMCPFERTKNSVLDNPLLDIMGTSNPRSNERCFYDEFDFIDFVQNEYYVDPRGYYCTTPSKLRHSNEKYVPGEDLLIDLLHKKDMKYIHRVGNFNLESESGGVAEKEERNNEIMRLEKYAEIWE